MISLLIRSIDTLVKSENTSNDRNTELFKICKLEIFLTFNWKLLLT